MKVKTIAVLGSGIMGSGIAQVAALGGFRTLLIDINQDALQKAVTSIDKNIKKGVELGKVDSEKAAKAKALLATSTEMKIAAQAELVIEAVPENLKLKLGIYELLDAHCPPETVFASNTSALSITEMAGATKRRQNFIGMHFFNPVHKMKLIEIIRGKDTSQECYETARDVGKAMGKETVEVNEAPGFVTSRMNALIGNEAFYMLEEGVASARDIDKALKLGLNHPMGPFEMIDLVGLDTRLSILKFLHKELGEKFKPCPLIEKYVSEGRLGRKSGKGVYDYGKGK